MVWITRRMMEDDWGACSDVSRLFELVQPGGGDMFELTEENLRKILASADGEVWFRWFQTNVVPADYQYDLGMALQTIEETERWAFEEALVGKKANFLKRWGQRNWSILPGGGEPTGYTMEQLTKRFKEGFATPVHRSGLAERSTEEHVAAARRDIEGGTTQSGPVALGPPEPESDRDAAQRILRAARQARDRVLSEGTSVRQLTDVLNQLRFMDFDRQEAASLMLLIRARTRR